MFTGMPWLWSPSHVQLADHACCVTTLMGVAPGKEPIVGIVHSSAAQLHGRVRCCLITSKLLEPVDGKEEAAVLVIAWVARTLGLRDVGRQAPGVSPCASQAFAYTLANASLFQRKRVRIDLGVIGQRRPLLLRHVHHTHTATQP
eukprot:357202-Chlamydomonas_euryale.AAC.22